MRDTIPYSNMEPFSSSEMVVHSENINPMLVVANFEKETNISMWGNIAVRETVDVRHNGEFQRELMSNTIKLQICSHRFPLPGQVKHKITTKNVKK